MAKTHRATVAWICGVPFAIEDGKTVAALLRMSTRLPRLAVNADGTLATMTEAETNALANQLVSRIEMADVVCTECEEAGADEHAGKPKSELGRMLFEAIIADKVGRRNG